jgi:hypothetical protein
MSSLISLANSQEVAHSYPDPERRSPEQRRVPPDRGIVLLQAKGRIGPEVWALYGKVERPVVLKDDLYIDNRLNDFYRDAMGRAFVLLPYVPEDVPNRFELADAAYRRAVALGVTEQPEIFFTCVYQFQLPDYRCIGIHADQDNEILSEPKCLQLLYFEQARLAEQMGATHLSIQTGVKIKPVTVRSKGEPSNNLLFALNTLVLHHGYDVDQLCKVWDAHR